MEIHYGSFIMSLGSFWLKRWAGPWLGFSLLPGFVVLVGEEAS
ncbi:hypothetical protein [Rubritalea tangerina]